MSTQLRSERLVSLDACRGFMMLAMASAGFGLAKVAASQGGYWEAIAHQFEHVPWSGCASWDLIQPGFMFMVGVAMSYSDAARRARGETFGRRLGHALIRSVVLVALGVLLASRTAKQTNFQFTNVLAQIGLGYTFVFLLLGRGVVVQLAALALILGGWWWAFYSHPLPARTELAAIADSEMMLAAPFTAWSPRINFGATFDRWFLNLFPRAAPFQFHPGGYPTLNFVPSIGTILLGVLAAHMLRSSQSSSKKLLMLVAAGVLCLILGLAASHYVCPIVKRIWTPSWVLYSGGWAFLMLAVFYAVIDHWGFKGWAFPLVIVGMNSIAVYLMSELMRPWITATLRTHFGQQVFSGSYGTIVQSVCVLLVIWLLSLWMFKQRLFVKI